MYKKIFLLPVILFLFAGSLKAQNEPQYNFYQIEPLVLNPAAAGLNRNFSAFLDYRKQWAGLNGAPENLQGALHGLITPNMGLGLTLSNYTSSVFKSFSTSLNYSYKLQLGENHFISPGVSAGIRKNSIDAGGLDPDLSTDPALYSEYFDKTIVTTGFGVHYQYKNLIIDAAIPKLYSTETLQLAQTVIGYAAYNFSTADEKWNIMPSVLYRLIPDKKSQWDMGFMMQYDKKVFAQASYRTNKDVMCMLGVNISGITLAYSYEFTKSALESVSNGSHEIAIRYILPFSFVQ